MVRRWRLDPNSKIRGCEWRGLVPANTLSSAVGHLARRGSKQQQLHSRVGGRGGGLQGGPLHDEREVRTGDGFREWEGIPIWRSDGLVAEYQDDPRELDEPGDVVEAAGEESETAVCGVEQGWEDWGRCWGHWASGAGVGGIVGMLRGTEEEREEGSGNGGCSV